MTIGSASRHRGKGMEDSVHKSAVGGAPRVGAQARRVLRAIPRAFALTRSAFHIYYLRMAYRGFVAGLDSYVAPGCQLRISPGAVLELHGVHVGRGCEIVAGPGSRIEIFAESIGQNSVLVAREKITIGKGTLIAEMVVIRDSNHDRRNNAPLAEYHHRSAPINIGSNVWLAAHATVLSGVTIGDDATIGAGAVVTRDVPAASVAIGVPARTTTQRANDNL